MKFSLKRFAGYLLGFLLFYAPFALFQKAIFWLVTRKTMPLAVHSICFRKPIIYSLISDYSIPSLVGFSVLALVAFVFGPLFCGKLCPAGAFSELTSHILPDKYKIDWANYTAIAPIRYGMLCGYILSPLMGFHIACSFCNYYVFDLLVNYVTFGFIVSLSSSLILTSIFWLLLFGIFTKGGRGFCNFLCPTGAALALLHRLGSKLPFSHAMRVDKEKCVGCKLCEKKCPMRSVRVVERKAEIGIDNCICCGVCEQTCPKKAIRYGRMSDEK